MQLCSIHNHETIPPHPARSFNSARRSFQRSIGDASLDLEAESSHAGLVLLNCGLAFLRWVIGFGEEHAVVASGLFGLAYAAGLVNVSIGVER